MFGATKPHYVYSIDCSYLSKYTIVVFVDINECSSIPCVNGATCTDAVDWYTCACVSGYTGTYCETGNSLGCQTPTAVYMHVIKYLYMTFSK